jgi:hypothetical protein
MKPGKLLTTLAIVSVVLIAGCKKDNFEEIVGVCPIVESTNPSNLATGVPLNQVITVTFNEKINPATITATSFTLQGVSSVSGTVSYSGTTALFTPSGPLTPNTTYTGRIKSSVKDMNGNALPTDYVWAFSTGATLSPMVISTDPPNNANSVSLNKTVTATFNIPMDASTLTATTFTLKQGTTSVTGIVSYTGTTAYFSPSAALTPNTIYTGTITKEAKNVSGTALANDYVWTFTTGTILAPTVISTDPSNNASGVALNKTITATFSEPMNASTITGLTFMVKQGATPVAGVVSYTGTTAFFNPSANLLSNTTYTVTITTGAENLTGTSLANDYVWSFSTKTTLGPPIVDLKSVGQFGIISGVGVSNNAGQSEIHDLDVGIYPGVRSSITGFFAVDGGPGLIFTGAFYASDDIAPPGVAAMLMQAKQDLTDAYLAAEAATSPAPATVSGDIGGTTLAPGIYKSTSSLLIQSGNLTLDAQGDANAVWIFQIASAFTTIGGAGGSVILTGGAQAKNIYWQTGSSATIGDYTTFKGNVLALSDITMNPYATAEGRMLARNGSVVLTSTNIINKP